MDEKKENIGSEKASDFEELKGFFPEEYDLSPDELVSESDADSFDKNELSPIWEGVVNNTPITVPTPPAKSNETVELKNKADVKTEEKLKKKQKPSGIDGILRDLFDIIEMFVLCTAVILMVFSFLARITIVDGESMTNTLHDGEYLIISDVLYSPKQGDIVVLQDTSLEEQLSKPLIKRVIALGGETVDISSSGVVTITKTDGSSYILGEEYTKDEPYMKRAGHFEVPEGSIFVMGDNRNGSTDSRDSRVGFVDERCVIGKVIIRISPTNKFGPVE